MVAISAIRRSRYWPFNTLSSISAILKPTTMLGGMMYFKPRCQALSFLRLKCFIRRSNIMRVQIVHNQAYFNNFRVTFIKHGFDLMRPVPASPARGHADMALTSQWFSFHKDLRKTIPDIFIVYPFGLSRPSRNRCAHFSDQLLIGYVHTHDGIVCAIRQMIKTENVLHCCYKGRIFCGGIFQYLLR